jgi:DNA-binding transcriptional MerR regulator
MSLCTIEQLAQAVGTALDLSGCNGQASGRVRVTPDQRTIRYYTTLGLLDRPAEFRGRTALYGPRHLLQLVAIKRLQSAGQSLAQVQAALLSASDARLQELSGLTSEALAGLSMVAAAANADARRTTAASEDSPSGAVLEPARTTFWTTRPAPPAAEENAHPILADVETSVRVRLAEGVSLMVDRARASAITPDSIRDLTPAFKGLVSALQDAGWLKQPPSNDRTRHHGPGAT